MSNDTLRPKKDFKQIHPTTTVTLTRADEPAESATRTLSISPAMLILVLVGAVLIGILGLNWRTPPPAGDAAPPLSAAVSPPTPPATPSGSPSAAVTPPETPWNEAQQATLRKKAQMVLAAMLQAQQQLQQKSVDKWAAAAYAQGLGQAEQGDQQYQAQQFEAAIAHYEQAQTRFNNLLVEADSIVQQALKQGQSYLQAAEAVKAAEAFAKALVIEPANPEAITGAQRTGTLDEVNALQAQAAAALQQGQLEQAQARFKQALSLDQRDERAKQGLAAIQQRRRNRDFNQAMSAGYNALEQNEYAQAEAEFSRALQIKPNAAEAGEALHQNRQRRSTARLTALLHQGQTLETEERWNDAANRYAEALQLEPHSAEAQQKQRTAQWRARLDQALTRTLAQPGRLSDSDVYQEALALQTEINAMPVLAPRIRDQKNTLDNLLRQVSEPVTVQFISDNKTEVQIYKVGKLGAFESTQMELLPGRYVAVGNRTGYRDVRVEFSVQAEKTMPPVVIQCQEVI